jgi:uncharacterized protein YjbI with pentapeptide repeats
LCKGTRCRQSWSPGSLGIGSVEGGGWRAHGRDNIARAPKAGIGFDYVHSLVDDHSRLAYSEILPDEKGHTCAGFLRRAAAYFHNRGITRIERVMTDNAWAYRSPCATYAPTSMPDKCSSDRITPGRTGKWNASTAPCKPNGPTARYSPPTTSARRPLHLGSRTTTLDAVTAHSAASHRSADCNQPDVWVHLGAAVSARRDLIVREVVLALAVGLAVAAVQIYFDGRSARRSDQLAAQLNAAAQRLENLRFVRDRSSPDPNTARPFAALDLAGQPLQGLDLVKADFTQADLHGADLHGTKLTNVLFDRTNLRNALLSALLDGAFFEGASLIDADLRNAALANANLSNTCLTGADLGESGLNGAFFDSANLTRADFAGAVLTGADLTGAKLDGAKLDGANFNEACWDTRTGRRRCRVDTY